MKDLLNKLKDVIDYVDQMPSIPALLIGVAVGAIIPFKLIMLCVLGVAIWGGLKYIEL
jgi:hypothetical protein